MKTRQSGFTLMELLTTVVIAGVVIAMAVPSYSRFVASGRVMEQTNDLVGALQLGRSEAIRRNATLTLCRANTAVTACSDTNANWPGWILVTAGGTIIRQGALDNYGSTLHVSSTLVDERIIFGPDGLARTGGAMISTDPDDPDFITVCSTRYSNENIRRLVLGAGSRISNLRESGTCS